MAGRPEVNGPSEVIPRKTRPMPRRGPGIGLAEQCRELTEEALDTLVAIMRGDIKGTAGDKHRAVQTILERGYGKAPVMVDIIHSMDRAQLEEAALAIIARRRARGELDPKHGPVIDQILDDPRGDAARQALGAGPQTPQGGGPGNGAPGVVKGSPPSSSPDTPDPSSPSPEAPDEPPAFEPPPMRFVDEWDLSHPELRTVFLREYATLTGEGRMAPGEVYCRYCRALPQIACVDKRDGSTRGPHGLRIRLANRKRNR